MEYLAGRTTPQNNAGLAQNAASTSNAQMTPVETLNGPPYGLAADEAASVILQATPFVQHTASSFRIGQPKTPVNIPNPPVALAKVPSLITAKHFSDLRRQQGKLAREGHVKLIAHLFMIRRGEEMGAPSQVCHLIIPILIT